MLSSSNPGTICKYVVYFAAILFLLCGPAIAAEGADLQVSVLRYEPVPAQIGEYVTVWVKIENLGYAKAEDVQVMMVPDYPFSLDSPGNAVKDIGILTPDNAAVEEYRLFVDDNAKNGVDTIEVWYREDTEGTWYKKEFDITVGSTTFDSKGNVQLQGSPILEPEVFMPGNRGTIKITLANIATSNSVTVNGEEFDTNARVQSASLEGADGIDVTTDTYYGNGVIGPGESLNLTYNIMVGDEVEDGTYYLDFSTVGSSHAYNNNWRIPITVDSSAVTVIPSQQLTITNGGGTLEFDVANTHPNMLSSVSIRPQADGVDFSPTSYFIGAMDPDELFTIQFTANASNATTDYSTEMTVIANYRNGQNSHSEIADVHELRNTVVKESNTFGIVAGIVVLLGIAVVGYMWYRRRKGKQ
ncbi:MAG: COG1361 S-layer family protein [Methanolobus sp.]|nr:COG1361 S-layer family protein [Methanolobus sp.]